jgi:hypothetical protein
VADWAGALRYGIPVARSLLAENPSVTVRQVHDPLSRGALCGCTITLHVRWRRLPAAYRRFVQDRLEPGAGSLLLRDVRAWPVLDVAPGHSFQVGSPVGGWSPDAYSLDNPAFSRLIREFGDDEWQEPCCRWPRRNAERAGEPELERDLRRAAAGSSRPTHRVLYPTPETLSACVADLYRARLQHDHRDADRCVVETDRLLDPWQVLTGGLVPYWCETSSVQAVAGAELWMAGSARFHTVDVLPSPPGWTCDANADLTQWRAVAWFGLHRGDVSQQAVRRYPLSPLPTSHAAAVLRAQPRRRSEPSRLGMAQVLGALRGSGQAGGILVL